MRFRSHHQLHIRATGRVKCEKSLGIKETIKNYTPVKSTKQSNAKKSFNSKSSSTPSKASHKPRQTVLSILSGSDEEIEERESQVSVPDNSNEEESKENTGG